MSASESKKSILQFLKFVLVGASNTLIDLVVTFALNAIFGLYFVAKIIGYACGILNSYFWNSRWTFREERHRDAREIVSFLIVNLVTLGLSLLLQWLFRDVWQLGAWWTQTLGDNWFTHLLNGERFCLLLASGVALVVNFLGNKLVVFRKNKEA